MCSATRISLFTPAILIMALSFHAMFSSRSRRSERVSPVDNHGTCRRIFVAQILDGLDRRVKNWGKVREPVHPA
jgi:hypothetical protein